MVSKLPVVNEVLPLLDCLGEAGGPSAMTLSTKSSLLGVTLSICASRPDMTSLLESSPLLLLSCYFYEIYRDEDSFEGFWDNSCEILSLS